jgi:hypothetical protein
VRQIPRSILPILPGLILAGFACAQNDPAALPHRPLASNRLVAHFQFDEPEPYEVPRHWELFRGEREGGDRRFPAWNTAVLDYATAHSGQGSVRLRTSGGSVRLRLNAGVVPVFPETEYLVSARVRSSGLKHARAAVSARYLDSETAPIPGSALRSELILGGAGEWLPALVPLSGSIAGAAYIQIDLEILQPEEYETPRLGQHQVWPQDYSAEVWFDDVAIVQLPRVRLTTASPTNLIEHPQRPELFLQVRDLSGQVLTARWLLQDAAGRTIDSHEQQLRGGSPVWMWTPRVERLGWYRAVMELSSGGQRVGATYLDFAWLPPRRSVGPGARDAEAFTIMLEDLPLDQVEHLPTLVRGSSAGGVTVPVWSSSVRIEDLPEFAQELARATASLLMGGSTVAFSLPRVPDQLAGSLHIDSASPAEVFTRDEAAWLPFLLPLLDRFGQSVRRWQIGTAARPAPGAPASAERLRGILSKLVPGPIIATAWPGDMAGVRNGADDYFLLVPSSMTPAALAELATNWSDDQPRLSYLLEPLSLDEFSREARAADLFKKVVVLWSTLQSEDDRTSLEGFLSCPQPWSWAARGDAAPMPRVELPVWRTLAQHLAGRRVVGAFPGGPGVFCVILAPVSSAPGAPGAIVAWQNGPAPQPAIEAYLGTGDITTVDMFGNRAPVPLSAGPVHRVPISPLPVLIEGIDIELARFTSSFRVQPDVLNSTLNEHHGTLYLTNPWRSHLQGRVTILEPGGLAKEPLVRDRTWRVLPRMLEFAIPPGQTAQLPLRLAFSPLEEHGAHNVVAEVELIGMKLPPLRLHSPLEIHLDGLELDLSYRIAEADSEIDVLLEAIITNRGESPATLEVTAFAAGYPRARASISDLPAGASIMRRFSFPRARAGLHNGLIAVTVYNPESGARINRSIRIE